MCALGVQPWNNLERTYHKLFYRFPLLRKPAKFKFDPLCASNKGVPMCPHSFVAPIFMRHMPVSLDKMNPASSIAQPLSSISFFSPDDDDDDVTKKMCKKNPICGYKDMKIPTHQKVRTYAKPLLLNTKSHYFIVSLSPLIN